MTVNQFTKIIDNLNRPTELQKLAKKVFIKYYRIITVASAKALEWIFYYTSSKVSVRAM